MRIAREEDSDIRLYTMQAFSVPAQASLRLPNRRPVASSSKRAGWTPASKACAARVTPRVPLQPVRAADNPELASTGGVPPGSAGGSGGGGGGDGGDSGSNGSSSAAALLLASKAAQALPAEFAEALRSGLLSVEMAQRFLDLNSNPLLGWLMKNTGFRERLLADPSFMVKMGIEMGIGCATKCVAEYSKRGEEFKSQIDFVFANCVMAIIADFMLVWLPAPTFTLQSTAKRAGALSGLFAGCPDNAFQKVQPGMPAFSFVQRVGAVVRNGMKLAGVGFFASLLGVGITNSLVGVRQLLDPTFVPLNAPQDVIVMSAAYGSYMASSSNLRYQILAGLVEERGIEAIFRNNHAVCAILSFIVRTGNTFLGSLLWVDYLRLLGLQKAPGAGH